MQRSSMCGSGLSSLDVSSRSSVRVFLFFFNDTATTEIYTLSLHDALPISGGPDRSAGRAAGGAGQALPREADRKSTRLNSSHVSISYAVFCLKKKNHLFCSPPPSDGEDRSPLR